MADFGFNTNIPLGVQPPKNNLADMVNTAAGLQSYQQAREMNPIQLEAARLQLQQAQQMNPLELEAKNLAVSKARQTLPFEVKASEATSSTAQSQAEVARIKALQEGFAFFAKNSLNLLQKDSLTPQDIDDFLVSSIKNAKGSDEVIAQARASIPKTGTTAELKAWLGRHSLNALDANAQIDKLFPAAAPQNLGATSVPMTMGSPFLSVTPPGTQAGPASTMTVPPTALETPTGGVNPITNLPQVIVRDALGRTTGFRDVQPSATTPTGSITPTIPQSESLETGKVYQQQIIDARAAATPAKVALNNIDTVLKYLPLAETGKFSEARQSVQSVLGSVTGNNATELAASARDIISKTIEDLALNKNAALGNKFAADLAAVQKSIASAERNPTAIKSSMEQLRPLLQHAYNYSQGLDKAVSRNPTAQYVKPQFDAAMNEAFDMKAMMMLNAYQGGSTDGLKKWTAANKVTVPEQQRLFGQLERYKALVDGDLGRYNTLAGAR
ncbi:hypothetical protein UFOVP953_5 [uncultured Caudovirales phage]|uniref:Uncharacterized protein n=1 Tax=uncultured Caudovirales phage TaxID=2100421 RepID=A0A6J5PZN8_9CAUD|nr:hypothetical protein UFOVP953_5 [uncultured Caudovirales phage]